MVMLSHLIVFVCVGAGSADSFVPADSVVGTLSKDDRLHLISPLEMGSFLHPGGWRMDHCGRRRADSNVGVKLGRDALVLRGVAAAASKGDFAISGDVPGEMLALGCWMYVPDDANVREVGFQLHDNEGESLLMLTPVDWTGWKWIETAVSPETLKQSYPQQDKNHQVDMPIRSVHVIWWSKQAGPSELTVDAAVARVTRPVNPQGDTVQVDVLGPTDVARNETYGGSLLLTNTTENAVAAQIVLSLQRDGRLFNKPLPDPRLGSDHALVARSWSVAEGQTIARNTLTDGLDYTSAETTYKNNYWLAADQYVELDRVREITAMGWRSGDANWIWKVDVSASLDGETFSPVPQLQGFDMHKKWQVQRFAEFKPFRAKTLRFHYHNDGQKMNVVRMPSALFVWDGMADERIELPRAGDELGRIEMSREVPAGSFDVVNFDFDPKLNTGQYLLASRLSVDGQSKLEARHVFVEPAWLDGVDERSRFGVNASQSSLAGSHRQLGVGWVRFENFKWPMVSPAPHEYAFNGSVAPWYVNVDQITREYRDAGLHVLPMMFQTPAWASSGGDHVPPGVRLSQPPRNDADFGEFAFQSVARYGSNAIAAANLKTQDGVSGLDRIQYYELGNEPNLNPLRDESKPPTWGPWAGTMNRWWQMWRHGAEAVKRADANAVLLSPGFAGMTSGVVDQMRAFKYDDGKCPLDFVDAISVHFYSGRTPPEAATRDANTGTEGDTSFVEHLKRLAEWRDRHKPGAAIWMTETGYDTAGPIGTDQWTQAARLPRVVALCLAKGIDKVFVYRESGSAPSQHAAAGLLRDDLSRKPSWYTYATLIRQLDHATAGQRLPHDNPRVWLQTWHRDGATMLMASCVTGEAELGIELGRTTVTDAFGGVTQVESTHRLPLCELPLYLSGFSDPAPLEPLVRHANAAERERANRRAADAKRRIYLFNFGKPNEAVAADIGRIRYFAAVSAERMYDVDAGFGFVGRPATRDDFTAWKNSALERHAVKFDKGQVFRFDVDPGTYELRVNAKPWGNSADILLTGGATGEQKLTFIDGTGETVVTQIDVAGHTIELHGTYQHLLRWLVMQATD